jgi:hypothetical protein
MKGVGWRDTCPRIKAAFHSIKGPDVGSRTAGRVQAQRPLLVVQMSNVPHLAAGGSSRLGRRGNLDSWWGSQNEGPFLCFYPETRNDSAHPYCMYVLRRNFGQFGRPGWDSQKPSTEAPTQCDTPSRYFVVFPESPRVTFYLAPARETRLCALPSFSSPSRPAAAHYMRNRASCPAPKGAVSITVQKALLYCM